MIRRLTDWLATPSYPTYGSGLFTDVWNPRRSAPRQRLFQRSIFSHDYPTRGGHGHNPTLTVDDQTFTFENGCWVGENGISAATRSASRGSSKKRPDSGSEKRLESKTDMRPPVPAEKKLESGSDPRVRSLKKEVQSLREENNALRLRNELLFDMLTEATVQAYGLEQLLEDSEKALTKEIQRRH